MKTEKFSFGKIKDILSRDEMKQIMAGSGGGNVCAYCYSNYNGRMNCSVTNGRCYCPITNPGANYC